MKSPRVHRVLGFLALISVFAGVPSLLNGQSADKVASLFEKFSWRSVGPAVPGGRTVDIDVVAGQPWIIYAAVGPSGVWKSDNNGITWEPVFYKESTVSVGDVTIAPSQPNIVWVGTGEATSRNSVTIGDGVYKSTDAGKTWTNMGLRETRHISRIIVNRGDPNIVYVAAMGHLWGPHPDRGVYKSIDGGKTWIKSLYVDENTGIADMAMDPSDSLTLFAAAYEHRRLPYYFSSGGPSSGFYKTTDGGTTWKRLAKDLPEGILGRIGIAVSRTNPSVIYALIEHKEKGGIWRSEDKGESWKRMCDTETANRVNNRPFYYSHIHVDPTDDKTVYVLSTGLYVSTDMGQHFRPIGAGVHSDHHAFWVDPSNPLHLVDGNDGGVDVSYDGGKNWFGFQNMDAAEVYQVGYDLRNPYYVYCGLQDNGVWGAPSASLDPRGITNEEWYMVGGGDGFYVQPDPGDPATVYANSQMNGLYRFNLNLLRSKAIKPLAPLKEAPYRFNWNAPIHISPRDPRTVYCGGNYLFKTTDSGASWTIISPDLTTDDPNKQKDSGGPITPDNSGAESHCTITTISESPVAPGVIWAGTDDGNVQLSRDGGKTWKNLVKNIPGLPPFTWCSRLEASHFEAGTGYAAFDGHRTDDYATYIYKTSDYGNTWKPIKSNLPFGWVHVIREDSKNRNLLFAGTEFGVYASLNAGEGWFSLKNNLPTVAVHDIAIHPREADLIIGTHGRGIWILDDISFLQEMSEGVLDSDIYLFYSRPANIFYMSSRSEPFGKPAFLGKNPPAGLIITAYLKTEPKEKPKAVIKEAGGKIIYEIEFAKKTGIQRETWNLQYVPENREGKKTAPAGMGLSAMPYADSGPYRIEFRAGERSLSKTMVVQPDPRDQMKPEERKAQIDALVSVLEISRKLSLSVTAAKNIRRQLDALRPELIKIENSADPLRLSFEAFDNALKMLEKEIIPDDFFSLRTRRLALKGGSLSQQTLILGMSISNYPAPPTKTDLSLLSELSDSVNSLVSELNSLLITDLASLNSLLASKNLKLISIPDAAKI